jgi:type VI secretion system protein ImpF
MKPLPQFVPTLFDRLQDDFPQQTTEVTSRRLCSLSDYKAGVVRDLERLVNTRQSQSANQLAAFPDLKGSLLEYGMPDFTSKGLLNPEDRRLIQTQLEQAIRVGDRRFRNVKVRLLEQHMSQRMLTFRIDALLRLQSAERQVTFDAVLQVNTQEYKVQNFN